jgi:hypothetical protein
VATLLGWDLADNIPETLNEIEGLQAYVNALVQHDLALGNGTTFVEAALDLHSENSACAMQAQMDLQYFLSPSNPVAASLQQLPLAWARPPTTLHGPMAHVR